MTSCIIEMILRWKSVLRWFSEHVILIRVRCVCHWLSAQHLQGFLVHSHHFIWVNICGEETVPVMQNVVWWMSARKWAAGEAVGDSTDLWLLLWLDTAGIHRPRERERLWVQPWHCTSLAHPFIGCERHDISTICHHIKMDDHLHSYSHTNPATKSRSCDFANELGRTCRSQTNTHTNIVFSVSFYIALLKVSHFRLFIKPYSSWNKWPCGDKHTHFCVCINPCFVMKILYLI